MSCTSPLEGLPSTLACPAENVLEGRVLMGALPSCRFPFGCEEPVPLPTGYRKVNESSYACDEGYIGQAVAVFLTVFLYNI